MNDMRPVINAMVLGFVVALLWILAFYVFFNARESSLVNAMWMMAYITCPPFATNLFVTGWGNILIPFLNAGIYGAVVWLVLKLRASSPKKSQRGLA